MKHLQILIALLLILHCAIARAAEPLAVSAYVTVHNLLVVTVFSDAPTSVRIVVTLPPGWAADEALIMSVNARPIVQRTWHLTPSAGLGMIRVEIRDGRGNAVSARAYSEGVRPEAAKPAFVLKRWLPIVRR